MATNIERGFCLGYGGTNARVATCGDGDIYGFRSERTPDNPDEFFSLMGSWILEASEAGAAWAVAGFPGPVEQSGSSFTIGPFSNIPGLGEKKYDLGKELVRADPGCKSLIEQGFRVIAVNDGDLAAHAAAARIGDGKYERVADIILGTGVGGAVVARDEDGVYKASKQPFEVGHIVLGEAPNESFENTYSGTAIKAATGEDAANLLPNHPIWQKLGRGVGKLATMMSLVSGAELVVPSGGVGVLRYEDYQASLREFMAQYATFGSKAQKAFVPEIKPVPKDLAQSFEMYGAEGVMLDHMAQLVNA